MINIKKGFTLIEVLGVIVILGIIGLIVVPLVDKSIKLSRENSYKEQINSLLNVARTWGAQNTSLLPEPTEMVPNPTYELSFDTLKTSGLMEGVDIDDSNNIVDPRNEEPLEGCIIISYSDNQYKYEYDENCDA